MGCNYKRAVHSHVWQKGFPKVKALVTFPKDILILPPEKKTLSNDYNYLYAVLITITLN